MTDILGTWGFFDFARIWPAVLLAFAVILGGCAAMAPPPPSDTRDFRERAERRQAAGAEVAISVLGARESEDEFGARLASKGIQPLWLEVKN